MTFAPDAIFDNNHPELIWATIALFREDPTRSNRQIAEIAETSHPNVSKILRAFTAQPRNILEYLSAAGYWDTDYKPSEARKWPERYKVAA